MPHKSNIRRYKYCISAVRFWSCIAGADMGTGTGTDTGTGSDAGIIIIQYNKFCNM